MLTCSSRLVPVLSQRRLAMQRQPRGSTLILQACPTPGSNTRCRGVVRSPCRDLNSRPLPYQGSALPLSYKGMCGWAGLDLNQRRQSQRIYSPPPLTTRAPTRTQDGTLPAQGLHSGAVRLPARSFHAVCTNQLLQHWQSFLNETC